MALTDIEKKLLSFIEERLDEEGASPTMAEMAAHMGWQSPSLAAKYVARLKAKGLLADDGPRGWRNLRRVEAPKPAARALPLFGVVHAGPLHEAYETVDELVDAPEWMVPPGSDCGFLRVRGDSMTDKGIHDGDLVLVKRQNTARSGDVVVVRVDGRVTLKELRVRAGRVELIPWNRHMSPIEVASTSELDIVGLCAGLIRQRV